jgi:uncharacterized iron-regulated protein
MFSFLSGGAFIALALIAAEAQTTTPVPSPHPAASTYVPERVFDTRHRAFSDFEAMLADLARADVVIVGEQHDDPNTHRLESAILQGLARRRVPVMVSLEMFERDVQSSLDDYLAGRINEEEFLKRSRPWPRYATDYRALVEMARANQWPVVAANVPRRYAAEVARTGLAALDALPPAERVHVAAELQCPLDAYFHRFAETMGAHTSKGANQPSPEESKARTERYYYSQCVKDETMAESMATAFARREGRPGTIVHFTGAFHSDFGLGTVERARRRMPGRRVAFVTVLPTQDIDGAWPSADDLKRAEYLVYTVK